MISSPSRAPVLAAFLHCPQNACSAQMGTHRGSGGHWGTVLLEPGWDDSGFLHPVTWRWEQEFSSSSGIVETSPGREVVTTLLSKTALALSSGGMGTPESPLLVS